jgi:hypothetical protein
MKSEEDKIFRSGHEDQAVEVTGESADFVPSYQPERMSKITLEDLPDDASGVSAEVLALAKIPTLTEQLVPEATDAITESVPAPVDLPQRSPERVAATKRQTAQDTSLTVDSWSEQCQVRIDLLSDDIQKLNDRLDQLELPTKV